MYHIKYVIHHAGLGLPPVGSTGSAFTILSFYSRRLFPHRQVRSCRVFLFGNRFCRAIAVAIKVGLMSLLHAQPFWQFHQFCEIQGLWTRAPSGLQVLSICGRVGDICFCN